MSAELKPWPRMALFDKDNHPPFGLLRDSMDSPIRLVKPGKPPVYFGAIDDLSVFCKVFGLDYPRELTEE
jgi:hypothetical protein